jgi:hypothetical protein
MEEQNQLSEKESLDLIAKMIQKAKGSFHENGTSAILWGSVVAAAGLINFAELYWNFYIGFDIWLLVLAALIPQIFISIKERRNRKVVAHDTSFLNAIWLVYGISIFALLFYLNVVPGASDRLFKEAGRELLIKNTGTGAVEHFRPYVFSHFSLLLILYAIPTLATGIATKFRPMLFGGILCYMFFVASCFTATVWDMLFNGIAGIFNWLIPGMILRSRYLKGRNC